MVGNPAVTHLDKSGLSYFVRMADRKKDPMDQSFRAEVVIGAGRCGLIVAMFGAGWLGLGWGRGQGQARAFTGFIAQMTLTAEEFIRRFLRTCCRRDLCAYPLTSPAHDFSRQEGSPAFPAARVFIRDLRRRASFECASSEDECRTRLTAPIIDSESRDSGSR
jgi:hypothetical protein